MKERSGDRHYKNIDFEKNLVTASSKETLGEAAPLWRFSHFGVEAKDGKHCHLCHSRLKNWVAIKNTENRVVLIIGHDCYDKLISFLATKKLESLNLGSRKRYISEIKKYCKQHINESFLAWFETESDLPEILRSTLAFIKQFGYAPSLETAQTIVEHYKNNRQFELKELLNQKSRPAEVLGSIENNPFPEKMTLKEYEELELDYLDCISNTEILDNFFVEALGKTFHAVIPKGRAALSQWVENARNARATIVDEAWKKAMIDLQKRIAENQKNYRLLSFRNGINPRDGTHQWESWRDNKKYILSRKSSYAESEGLVFVEIDRELATDRVFLVTKLTMVPLTYAPMYRWTT